MCPAPSARADEIVLGDHIFREASIRNFDGEYLIFSSAGGQIIAKRLDDISAIFVDTVERLEEFNRAERAFEQRKYEDAARLYEAALVQCRGFWKNLARIRYMQACDGAGDIERAAAAFILVAQALPDKAGELMPRNVAAASQDKLKAALSLLDAALTNPADQGVYWHLEAMRLSILEVTESVEADKIAAEIVERLRGTGAHPSRFHLQMLAIRIEVKHSQYKVALNHIDDALAELDEAYLPELLFLKGKCLFGLADSREGFLQSGLAFLRVIVHYPKSRFCAESMLWAGRVHEHLDRMAKALELYQACKELPGAGDDLVQAAEDAAQQLRTRQGH